MRPARGANSSKAASSPPRKRFTSAIMRWSSSWRSGLFCSRAAEVPGDERETSRKGAEWPDLGNRPELPPAILCALLEYPSPSGRRPLVTGEDNRETGESASLKRVLANPRPPRPCPAMTCSGHGHFCYWIDVAEPQAFKKS